MRKCILWLLFQSICTVLAAKPLKRIEPKNTKPLYQVYQKNENLKEGDNTSLLHQKDGLHKPDVRKNFKKVVLPSTKPSTEKYSPQKNKNEWNIRPTKVKKVVPADSKKI